MARAIKKLSARTVTTLTKPGRHSDGAGLYLAIDADGRRRWVFLFPWEGKRREMGLGPASTVSLARARELADEARRHLSEGRNPIDAREAARDPAARKPTFGEVSDALIAAKEAEWRNDKHRAQWKMTLEVYAKNLRPKSVDEIDTAAVLDVLKNLWATKPETASRLRGRIEAVLDAAKAQGHRTGENPAAWRGHLSHLLPKRQKLSRGHHAALAYADMAEFITKLRACEGVSALALEFLILTATRSGETLGATWSEFDLEKKVWTIPAARMKAAREHRVPLTNRALEIIEKLAEAKTGDFVFPGQKPDRPLSGMAMEMLLRRMKRDDVTVHGFRSAFRDWAGNETHFAREVAEAALAHVIGDKAEQAYRRSDALEKRRELMAAWSRHCEPRCANNAVVQLRIAHK